MTPRKADRVRRVGRMMREREGERRARRRMEEGEQRRRRKAGRAMRHGERESRLLDRMGVAVAVRRARASASPEVPAGGSRASARLRSEGSSRAVLREDLQSSWDQGWWEEQAGERVSEHVGLRREAWVAEEGSGWQGAVGQGRPQTTWLSNARRLRAGNPSYDSPLEFWRRTRTRGSRGCFHLCEQRECTVRERHRQGEQRPVREVG